MIVIEFPNLFSTTYLLRSDPAPPSQVGDLALDQQQREDLVFPELEERFGRQLGQRQERALREEYAIRSEWICRTAICHPAPQPF